MSKERFTVTFTFTNTYERTLSDDEVQEAREWFEEHKNEIEGAYEMSDAEKIECAIVALNDENDYFTGSDEVDSTMESIDVTAE